MLLIYFSKANNHDVANKHNIDGETWPQAIVPTYLKKKDQNLSHLGQNNLVKAHTPYLRDD
jgi:hypothetical protein